MPKSNHSIINSIPFFLALFLIFNSCNAQENPTHSKENNQNLNLNLNAENQGIILNKSAQIGEYVVDIFEDSKGNLWFGTVGYGVAKYDGKNLSYFTINEGLPNSAVVDILEDENGTLWFATHNGLSKFDGRSFTNFTTKDGLCHFRLSNLLIDSKDNFWVGTWGGVCLFDRKEEKFIKFELPNPDIEIPNYLQTADWVTEILEDKNGNIWIGRSGYGATKFDGENFSHFTKKEGLPSNCAQSILEDKNGNIWFGTRVAENDNPDENRRKGRGGLSKFDGQKFTHFPDFKGLSENNVYTLYNDKTDAIWISATGVGVYKFDGQNFQLFEKTNRMDLTYSLSCQSILEDSKGRIWLGYSGGLFRLIDGEVLNVTEFGPWD